MLKYISLFKHVWAVARADIISIVHCDFTMKTVILVVFLFNKLCYLLLRRQNMIALGLD